ncbi:hypothetical protein AB674_13445 [Flavobacterium sp. ABG]|nr:hypothetical protein AB674_13445 [Flavobacterium sp. ABG]
MFRVLDCFDLFYHADLADLADFRKSTYKEFVTRTIANRRRKFAKSACDFILAPKLFYQKN